MKVFASALLAIAAQAIHLQKEGGQGEGKPDFDCGPAPEIPEGATIEDFFFEIAGEDEMIDEHEAKAALKCAVQWEFLGPEEAEKIYKEGEKLAGEDGKLSYHELPHSDSGSDSGSESDHSCGSVPEIPEGFTEADLFHEIAGEDGHIDEFEAMFALGCAVEWGFMTEEHAKEIYKAGEKAAGEDGLLSLEESGMGDEPLAFAQKGKGGGDEDGSGPDGSGKDGSGGDGSGKDGSGDDFDPSICGDAPELPEEPTDEDAKALFHAIAGDDGEIDGEEAYVALRCAHHWGFITEEEGKAIYKAGEKAAGEDGKLSMAEAEKAFADDVAKE